MKAKNEKFKDPKKRGSFSDALQKFGYKLGSNRILCSLRDGFGVAGVPMLGMIIPVILATMFFNNGTMLGNIKGIKDSAGMIWATNYIYPFLIATQQAASAPFALLFLTCTAFFMSKNFVTKGSPLTATILTVACFFALDPFGLDWNSAITTIWSDGNHGLKSQPFNEIGITNLGTNGLIPAIVVAILIPIIYGKLEANQKFRIKLPNTIPPAIADVLTNVISFTLILTGTALITWAWALIAHAAKITVDGTVEGNDPQFIADNIFTVITNVVGTKFEQAAVSPWFTMVLALLMTSFWIFGIHGTNLWTPIQVVVCMPSLIVNITFWIMYTNSNIQAVLVGANGTSITDTYYDITGHLQDFMLMLKDKNIQKILSNEEFVKLMTLDPSSAEFKAQFAAVMGNADFIQNIVTYGASNGINIPIPTADDSASYQEAVIPLLTKIVTGATYQNALTGILDINNGFIIQGRTYNSVQLIDCLGTAQSGGTGATFGLTVAILMYSKYKPYREVAKLEAVPAVFGINEPLVFGLPLVLNFVMAIPFIIGGTAMWTMSHFLVIMHVYRPTVAYPVAFIPMILLPYLNSGFDWRAAVAAVVFVLISISYFLVFIKLSEKYTINQIAKQSGLTYDEYLEQNKGQIFVDKIIANKVDKILNKKEKLIIKKTELSGRSEEINKSIENSNDKSIEKLKKELDKIKISLDKIEQKLNKLKTILDVEVKKLSEEKLKLQSSLELKIIEIDEKINSSSQSQSKIKSLKKQKVRIEDKINTSKEYMNKVTEKSLVVA